MICFTIASPVPPTSRDRSLSTPKKRSKILGICSSAIPRPVSATTTSTPSPVLRLETELFATVRSGRFLELAKALAKWKAGKRAQFLLPESEGTDAYPQTISAIAVESFTMMLASTVSLTARKSDARATTNTPRHVHARSSGLTTPRPPRLRTWV